MKREVVQRPGQEEKALHMRISDEKGDRFVQSFKLGSGEEARTGVVTLTNDYVLINEFKAGPNGAEQVDRNPNSDSKAEVIPAKEVMNDALKAARQDSLQTIAEKHGEYLRRAESLGHGNPQTERELIQLRQQTNTAS